jgi:MFS family permease
MPAACDSPTILERRRARRLAVWNGAIWAVGNGLVSTALILYWAKELKASWFGLGIGLISAAPQVIGLLRLGAPAMMARLADRKRFCITTYLLSVLPAALIPLFCKPGWLPSPSWSLIALILLWCLHQFMQYLGTIALWSWLADAAPARIRGRFIGWRQRWVMAGTAIAAVIATVATFNAHDINDQMHELNRAYPTWVYYGFLIGFGMMFLLTALVPLAQMPACQRRQPSVRMAGRSVASWTAPFRDLRFLRLLLFGCWFSFFNGVTQAAQGAYPMTRLGVTFIMSLVLVTGLNLGQWAVSPWAGRWADRFGNRPVMFVSQLLAAAGILFFLVAAPAQWWWIIGAWTLWIAYAGLNVCLPNLTLKLAPHNANAAYIAAYNALTGLLFAVSSVAGGLLLDYYKDWTFPISENYRLAFFPCIFVFGWVTRSLGALLILWIKEPPTSMRKEREG